MDTEKIVSPVIQEIEKERAKKLEILDTGKRRKGNTGANLGWYKNTENIDIREAMKARGIGQVKLGMIIGMNTSNVNKLLKRKLPENIRQALFETIKRYDPETNPHGL